MNFKLPNFLVVGAAKCGTTSLYYYLKQHPDIYLSERKEGRFLSGLKGTFTGPGDSSLNESIIESLDDYTKLFENVADEKMIGDISPEYLYYYDKTIRNIKQILGDVKIIIILRNPLDRAYSAYQHMRRDGRETLTFEEACVHEDIRLEKGWEHLWAYTKGSYYFSAVKAYMENFSQVKVLLFDDLKRDALQTVWEICDFLDVDKNFQPETGEKYNYSGIPRNQVLDRFFRNPGILSKMIVRNVIPRSLIDKIKKSIYRFSLKKTSLDKKVRAEMLRKYEYDIAHLGRLLERDLSFWLR